MSVVVQRDESAFDVAEMNTATRAGSGRIPEHSFRRLNSRLALFQRSAADRQHWEARWSKGDLKHYLEAHRRGKLDEFEELFTRRLPKDLPILEAGCGKGQLVMALAARGYRVEGLDYAEATIQRIHEAAPELNVRTGDVYRVDVPEGTYGGYISIGLFEHNPDGPVAALAETRRVLHRDGVALISVPYLNRRRTRLLKRVNSVSGTKTEDGLNFYQYYFSQAEFQNHVEQAGMRVIECYPYGVHAGLARDSAFWNWLGHCRLFVWPLQIRFIHWCARAPRWLRFDAAHMLMFVCRHA